jgi:hypothetical protein
MGSHNGRFKWYPSRPPSFWAGQYLYITILGPTEKYRSGVLFNQALKLVVRYLRSFLKNVAQQDCLYIEQVIVPLLEQVLEIKLMICMLRNP